MSGLPAGMKQPLIVPVKCHRYTVQLLIKYGTFPSMKLVRYEGHGVSSPTQVTSAEVGWNVASFPGPLSGSHSTERR